MSLSFNRFGFLIALALLFAACRDAKVSAYRVPKEKDPEMPGMSADSAGAPNDSSPASVGRDMAGMAVTAAHGDDLTWTAPTHWKVKPASAMRKGSYTVPGEGGAEADLSITAFPGTVGGELANLNRWRGQLHLPPLAEVDLGGEVTRLEQNNLKFAIVDFVATGENPQRILGAMVPFGNATWFFKLMGPDGLVAKEKPAFLDFIKTVQAASP
jgi:hypothetical protein